LEKRRYSPGTFSPPEPTRKTTKEAPNIMTQAPEDAEQEMASGS